MKKAEYFENKSIDIQFFFKNILLMISDNNIPKIILFIRFF